MVRFATFGAAAILAASSVVYADIEVITKDCGEGIGKCPSSKPCCSQYGQCGIGAYCLGGCDPLNSFQLQSCVAAPQCKSQTYKFTDENSSPILSNTKYLGDASKADWVSDGTPLFGNSVVYLTMAPNTVGTVLASTRYVWYGKISATMRTSRGRGVVTAFIMMSDVKDEIDYEWVGVDLQTSQTNYYWTGVPDYTHSGNITMAGNTFSEWHTYTIDWTPDSITWSVDGQVGRTKKRTDTYNATTGNWEFPQTPSRIQLSLWPGGLKTNGQGTIDWAGGEIEWSGPDIDEHGYYFAQVSEVTVDCYNPPSGARGSGDVSYEYTDANAVNTSVLLSDDGTILSSFLASGTNKTVQLPSSKISSTVIATTINGKATTIVSTTIPTGSDVGTVPGLDGAGYDSGDLTSPDDSSGTGTGSSSQSTSTDWSQGGTTTQSSAPSFLHYGDKYVLWGNFIAIVLVAAAMATL